MREKSNPPSRWTLRPGDLPHPRWIARAPGLAGLENNAPFRAMTFRRRSIGPLAMMARRCARVFASVGLGIGRVLYALVAFSIVSAGVSIGLAQLYNFAPQLHMGVLIAFMIIGLALPLILLNVAGRRIGRWWRGRSAALRKTGGATDDWLFSDDIFLIPRPMMIDLIQAGATPSDFAAAHWGHAIRRAADRRAGVALSTLALLSIAVAFVFGARHTPHITFSIGPELLAAAAALATLLIVCGLLGRRRGAPWHLLNQLRKEAAHAAEASGEVSRGRFLIRRQAAALMNFDDPRIVALLCWVIAIPFTGTALTVYRPLMREVLNRPFDPPFLAVLAVTILLVATAGYLMGWLFAGQSYASAHKFKALTNHWRDILAGAGYEGNAVDAEAVAGGPARPAHIGRGAGPMTPWTLRPGDLPHPRWIAREPRLARLEDNPVYRAMLYERRRRGPAGRAADALSKIAAFIGGSVSMMGFIIFLPVALLAILIGGTVLLLTLSGGVAGGSRLGALFAIVPVVLLPIYLLGTVWFLTESPFIRRLRERVRAAVHAGDMTAAECPELVPIPGAMWRDLIFAGVEPRAMAAAIWGSAVTIRRVDTRRRRCAWAMALVTAVIFLPGPIPIDARWLFTPFLAVFGAMLGRLAVAPWFALAPAAEAATAARRLTLDGGRRTRRLRGTILAGARLAEPLLWIVFGWTLAALSFGLAAFFALSAFADSGLTLDRLLFPPALVPLFSVAGLGIGAGGALRQRGRAREFFDRIVEDCAAILQRIEGRAPSGGDAPEGEEPEAA